MKIYIVEKGTEKEIPSLVFTTGDSYIVDNGDVIWLWHGNNASVDEKGSAAAIAKKMDDARGGKPKVIAIDQGDDTPDAKKFKALCSEQGGLKIVEKDLAESFLKRVVKENQPPALFKVSSEEAGGNINAVEFVQVPAKKENLDPDDCMVLWVPEINTSFIWVGEQSNVKERVLAGQLARKFDKDTPGVQKEVFVDQGQEPANFMKFLK
ncbi:MAG: hypothetical protein JW839_12125 [Candidatus Lokiarchaeota archaeon]|nr:hypothetical protein [Candidatus Lokiarchaeota archaeon]